MWHYLILWSVPRISTISSSSYALVPLPLHLSIFLFIFQSSSSSFTLPLPLPPVISPLLDGLLRYFNLSLCLIRSDHHCRPGTSNPHLSWFPFYLLQAGRGSLVSVAHLLLQHFVSSLSIHMQIKFSSSTNLSIFWIHIYMNVSLCHICIYCLALHCQPC